MGWKVEIKSVKVQKVLSLDFVEDEQIPTRHIIEKEASEAHGKLV